MEMALPVFKAHTTTLLCLTTVMKAVVGVAGGATRAALTQHHAVRFNMADVSAKDSSQETAVNLVASVVALFIITYLGNSLWIFALMVVLHVVFNYLAVRSVCLRTFNEPRFLHTIHRYLKHEVVSTPCEVNRDEPLIFYQMGPSLWDLRLCGFHIKIGHSAREVFSREDFANIGDLRRLYAEQKYLLHPDLRRRTIYVLLVEEASAEDVLNAYFHAVILAIVVCSINDHPLSVYASSSKESPFTRVCRTLRHAEWSRETAGEAHSTSGFGTRPSAALLTYVNTTARQEWTQLRVGLRQTGWNLEKHLLIADEWRITPEKRNKLE